MLQTLKIRFFDEEDALPADERAQPFAAPTLAAAASVVALGFLGSRLLGLLRTVAIAHQYGTSPDLDAYFVAFRVPDLIFQLLAGATLGSAFIPTFARVLGRDGDREAWRLASTVLNIVFLATAVLAIAGVLLAPLIVPLTAPGLGDDTGAPSEVRDLAIDLTRIMMLSPVLFAASGMFTGILNARHHFLAPALAPMFYNASIIIGALISDDVKVLALAVVVGALLHLLIQLPALRLVGMVWRPAWDWQDSAVREVGRLMGPRVVGLAAYHFNFLVATFFASTVGTGAISALNYAWLIVMLPLGLFAMAISTAAFPRLAEQAARNDEELPATLSRALRLIMFLTVPATLGLMVLAPALTAFLLRSGDFGGSSSDLVTGVLILYALGLVGHAGIEILSRGFYALSDTATPVRFAIISMVLNVVLSAVLIVPLEINGLALALSIATLVEFALLMRALLARMPEIDVPLLAASAVRTLMAAVLMAEVVALWLALLHFAGLLDLGTKVDAALASAGGMVLGAAVFFAASRLLGSAELMVLVARAPVPQRLRRFAGAE